MQHFSTKEQNKLLLGFTILHKNSDSKKINEILFLKNLHLGNSNKNQTIQYILIIVRDSYILILIITVATYAIQYVVSTKYEIKLRPNICY